MKKYLNSLLALLFVVATAAAASPSFEDFDQRAKDGESLSVVFFGASLTWGANATDPQLTSYRANMARRFEAEYPKAHFKFWDAAIGGTGSQLGVFRLRRDVLARKPDLVFLDFTANDDINYAIPETLASYEAIVRRLISEGTCAVVQVIFPFKGNVVAGTTEGLKRLYAHLAISHAYYTAVGDAVSLAIERVKTRETYIEKLWPVDSVHPGDDGYALFADAAWRAFQDAVNDKLVCRVPEKMINAETYMHSSRMHLAALGPLPSGWYPGKPNLTSAYYDFLMSRWLDGVCIASRSAKDTEDNPHMPKNFSARFDGSMVMLFGESTKTSGKYRVLIDGTPAHVRTKPGEPPDCFDPGAFSQKIGGNGHHVQVIVAGLETNVEHTIEIEPVLQPGQEIRLESICVAGGRGKVMAPKKESVKK